MAFSDKLRDLRQEKNLSQKTLADMAGVSQASIYQWEKGTRIPKIKQVRNIALILGVTLSDLIDDWSIYSSEEYKKDWDKQEIDELESWMEDYEKGAAPENSWMREIKLLEYFRKLNQTGEKKVVNYARDLAQVPEYKKKD